VAELLAAGWAARDWMNANIKSVLLPSRESSRSLPLARERLRTFDQPAVLVSHAYQHHRLSSAVGVPWLIVFLECVAEAADVARQQLDALRLIEEKAAVATSRPALGRLGENAHQTRGRNL